MAEVEIFKVERTELSLDHFHGGGIDWPAQGDVVDHYALQVAGWVASRDGSQPEIEVIDEGETIATFPVNRARLDVAAFQNEPALANCGFIGVVSAATLAREFKLEVDVVGGGSRHPLATISGRRSPLIADRSDSLQPMMITTLGRTGSTLLMLLLAQHPQLVVQPPFPFEVHLVTYWSKIFEALSTPRIYLRSLVADDEPMWIAGSEGFASQVYLDQNRAAHWLGEVGIEALARFGRDQVSSFYQASMAAQQKSAARYFVEKQLPHPIPRRIQREWFAGTKEIFLVRDFRDMLASILAFNKKRGLKGFRTDLFKGTEYVADIKRSIEALWRAWRACGASGLLVRYEDLVQEPRVTLQEIVTFLDLPRTDAMIGEMLEQTKSVEPSLQEQHKTSANLLSSIGRWRRDLPKDLRESAEQEFAEVLNAFGYER